MVEDLLGLPDLLAAVGLGHPQEAVRPDVVAFDLGVGDLADLRNQLADEGVVLEGGVLRALLDEAGATLGREFNDLLFLAVIAARESLGR